jgi:hypothetical protein
LGYVRLDGELRGAARRLRDHKVLIVTTYELDEYIVEAPPAGDDDVHRAWVDPARAGQQIL